MSMRAVIGAPGQASPARRLLRAARALLKFRVARGTDDNMSRLPWLSVVATAWRKEPVVMRNASRDASVAVHR